MPGDAVERPRLRLLQRLLCPLLLSRLGLGLRNRDDGLRTGLRRRHARDAQRRRARHARCHRRRERGRDRDGLGAFVSGDVGEHSLHGLFGRRRAGRVRALYFGQRRARAKGRCSRRARHDGRGRVGGWDFARFEGGAARGGGAGVEGGAVGGRMARAVRAGAGAEGKRMVGGGKKGGRCGDGDGDGLERVGRQDAFVPGGGKVLRGKVRGREGRRRDEERRDLYLGRLDVERAYDRVLLAVDAVERAERGGREVARDLGIGVAHDRVPYFDGTTSFENIYPYRATATRLEGGRLNGSVLRTGLLGKGTSIVAKEFEEGVGVGLHVELHLPLLDNLQNGGVGGARNGRGGDTYLELGF